MSYTRTPHLQLYKPTVGADDDQWGNHINASMDIIDTSFTTGLPYLPLTGGGTVTGSITVTDTVNAGTFSAMPPTTKFFAQDGAHISRIADRLFVGPATANDGRYPNVGQDWLQAFLATPTGGAEVGPMVGTTMSVLSINGQFGFVSGSRTSDNTTPNSSNTIGIASYAINDDTTSGSNAWAYYGEARRLSGVNDLVTFCCEFDVSNQGSLVQPNPYGQYPGETVSIQVGSGVGVTLPGAQDTSTGIALQGNPTKFCAGILFSANSIRGTDGVTGAGDAIVFAKGHTLSWYSADGNETSKVQGNISDFTKATVLEFNDTGFTVQGPGGGNLLVVPPVAGSVNFLSLTGAPAGGPVGVTAGGADTNVDLALVAKGAGYIAVTTPTATAATAGASGAVPAQVVGYLQVKIAGTIRKIPFYAV
jgi:hypothetical protein